MRLAGRLNNYSLRPSAHEFNAWYFLSFDPPDNHCKLQLFSSGNKTISIPTATFSSCYLFLPLSSSHFKPRTIGSWLHRTNPVWLLCTRIWNFVTSVMHPLGWQALWAPWLSLHSCVFSKCVTCLLNSNSDCRGHKKNARRLTQHHHEMCHCITFGRGKCPWVDSCNVVSVIQ